MHADFSALRHAAPHLSTDPADQPTADPSNPSKAPSPEGARLGMPDVETMLEDSMQLVADSEKR